MAINWGPHFIVPSEVAKTFSGIVVLRENFDETLLRKELETLGLSGAILKVTNPWYYRRKTTDTWIKVGESEDREENFPVKWDTSALENGLIRSARAHACVGEKREGREDHCQAKYRRSDG